MFLQRNRCAGTEEIITAEGVPKVSHRSYLIGLGSVFQQQGDNISVALLSCLVQRGVAHLEEENREDGHTTEEITDYSFKK